MGHCVLTDAVNLISKYEGLKKLVHDVELCCVMQAVLGEMGCKTREHSWPDYWYFKEERRLKPSSEKVS